jgi:plastocyanin
MRSRMRFVLPVIVLCAVLAAIPSLASSTGSSTATISGLESKMWSPMEVAITPGGTVTFRNASTKEEHGVVWKAGNPETPSCSGVPINKGETNWEGTCTFTKEGTYGFYCFVHGMGMSGKVFVNASGTIPTTTTTTTTSSSKTTSSTMTMTMTSTSVSSTTLGGGEGGGEHGQGGGQADSLFGSSVHLPASQRGAHVKGSVEVARSGSSLLVEVLATTAALAKAHKHQTRVGLLKRSGLSTGKASFSVALSAKAAHALHRKRRLTVSVRMTLTPPEGAKATRTLGVVLHAQ